MTSNDLAKSDSASAQLLARTDGRTNGRPTHPDKKSHVPNRAGETPSNLIVTLAVLAAREAENVRLGVELDATGLTDLTDRLEWLRDHRNPLDVLGRELALARRYGFTIAGLPLATGHRIPGSAPHLTSLSVPKERKRPHKAHEFTPAQLRIGAEWAAKQPIEEAS